MGSTVDYDVHYRKGPKQCGEPFPEIVAVLQEHARPGRRLLDLGCGQGRDSLLAATLGYDVVGVDLSKVGLRQLAREAVRKQLSIEVHHADIVSFRTRKRFDVIVLDRVLHLLPDDNERTAALTNALRLARKSAVVAIADGAKHAPLIHAFFAQRRDWKSTKKTKRFLFAHR